jgi:hypothetical protein
MRRYRPTTERVAQRLTLDIAGFKNYFKSKVQGDTEPGSGECSLLRSQPPLTAWRFFAELCRAVWKSLSRPPCLVCAPFTSDRACVGERSDDVIDKDLSTPRRDEQVEQAEQATQPATGPSLTSGAIIVL